MKAYYRIKPEALGWIGGAFELKTPISPFFRLSPAGFTEDHKPALIEQGILDSEGSLQPEAYAVLKALADATSFSNVRITGTFGFIDKSVYFGGEYPVALDNAGDHLLISTGTAKADFWESLSEIGSTSRLRNADLNLAAGEEAAQVFCGLLDMTRKRALAAYGGFEPYRPGISVSELSSFLEGEDSSSWVTSMLRLLPSEGVQLNEDTILKSLEALVASGNAETQDGLYALSGGAGSLGRNFLVMDQVVLCGAAQLKGETVVTSKAVILQAGLHDLLMIESSEQGFEFSTISAFDCNQLLSSMVSEAPEL